MNKIKILETEVEKFQYNTKIRASDLNYGNHLGHDNLISLIHDARLTYFCKNNIAEVNHENLYTFMIKSLTIDYINQGYLHENLDIKVYVGEISKFSFDLKYSVMRDNSLIALCLTTLVCYNNSKRRLDHLPPSILSVLTK
ncbi:acyl-CoA thioesterase [Pigmentibacter ruber]|uniref:acyl-CoA thioesterase n=1 Tax=Pigmentibacter ruber TaxID=2683196 RepID=UPI00131A6386|nr:thioesterase family protein [Pigmentibacter ruber]